MILELCKVGPVDLCRNVWILYAFALIFLCIYIVNQYKSTRLNKKQLVRLCTAHWKSKGQSLVLNESTFIVTTFVQMPELLSFAKML